MLPRGNISVLDICCGKGGDLKKWFHSYLGHYVGVDLAEKSVLVAKDWYMETLEKHWGHRRPKAIFMVNDVGSDENQMLKYLDQ